MNKIITIGHINPDTDSIIAAIAAKEFFLKAFGKEIQAFRAGEMNNETKFVLQKFGVEAPELLEKTEENYSIVLVDHNEKAQVCQNLDYQNVDYIIDHHKLSVVTDKPTFCRAEPVGSTSTLLAKMFLEKNVEISEITAKLLLAGILSDTLNFLSPTTTEEDKEMAAKINEIAKLDLKEFVSEMFKAKSSLEGISPEDIATIDYKNFEMGKYNVGIGTWETTLPESVDEKINEVLDVIKKKKEDAKLDYIFFMVVDILKQNCQLYLIGEEEKVLAEKVFGGKIENGIMSLSGVVSRKKQVAAPLAEELSK